MCARGQEGTGKTLAVTRSHPRSGLVGRAGVTSNCKVGRKPQGQLTIERLDREAWSAFRERAAEGPAGDMQLPPLASPTDGAASCLSCISPLIKYMLPSGYASPQSTFFVILLAGVFWLTVCLCTMCAWCLRRPEKDIRFPKSSCEPPCGCWKESPGF